MVCKTTRARQRHRLYRYDNTPFSSHIIVMKRCRSSGANAGGVLFPLILPPLISRFGLMKTVRIYAIVIAVCLLPVLPFMKARLPETRVHGPAPRSSSARAWLYNKNFWFFITINTIQGLGYFIPMIWLPSKSEYSFVLAVSNVYNFSLRVFPWSQRSSVITGADRRERCLRICGSLHGVPLGSV